MTRERLASLAKYISSSLDMTKERLASLANYPIQAFNYPLLTAVVQLNNLHGLRLGSCSNVIIHQLYRLNNL